MSGKTRRILQGISGWESVQLLIKCCFLGLFELIRIAFTKLWKGPRRKLSKKYPRVQVTVDSSIGTHCYIKILVSYNQ